VRSRLGLVPGLLLIAGLLGVGVVTGARVDAMRAPSTLEAARALIYLPSGEQARLMSLGFQQVSADWYWVKALQYFTDTSQELNQFRYLGDFLEVVLGIDPDFEYAYKFAGLALPYDTGRLQFANTDRAIHFLERGVQRFPRNWELHFYLGFYLLNFREDPAGAAEQFAAAAALPGSPPYLSRFAARLFSASGDLERGRVFAETMLASTTDPEERAKLERRVRDIEMEGRLRKLEEAARRFQAEHGRWPRDAEEVTLTYGLPPVPAGVILKDGTATAPDVERMIVHEHPKEPAFRAVK
jgi:tetratricopeptide (TPR) repeat protein